jgi:hypothetical protein
VLREASWSFFKVPIAERTFVMPFDYASLLSTVGQIALCGLPEIKRSLIQKMPRMRDKKMTIGLSGRPLRASGVTVALCAVALSGCASRNPFVSEGPEPRVENCMLLQQATPARFVCNGKIYTAVQLTDIRNGTK